MTARTRPSFWTWLSVFALLAQLVMPTAHASAWARQGGDPLLFAFCGTTAPALMRQLRENAPPELLAELAADGADLQAALGCDLCAAVHGAPALGGGEPTSGIAPWPVAQWQAPVSAAAPPRAARHAFDARGPPLDSLS